MSSINIEQMMPIKLAQALVNPLFPALDSISRSGHHTGLGELDNHAFLMDSQEYLEKFYARYSIELIRASEGFFYLHPRSTTPIPRSVLLEPDMMVGRILCYLYLSPERLTSEGIFARWELYGGLLILTDEAKLLKLVSNRSAGSDVDRQKLREKVRLSLNHLCRLGMVWFMGYDSDKLRAIESVPRFGAGVRAGGGPRETQRRLIRGGEAMPIKNHLQLNDETEENQLDDREEE